MVDGVEERLFVLEDSDDDDDEDTGKGERNGNDGREGLEGRDVTKEMDQPPPYSEAPTPTHTSTEPDVIDVLFSTPTFDDVPEQSAPSTAAESSSTSDPFKYYIQPGDTLSGISLKFGVDVSFIPSSTWKTKQMTELIRLFSRADDSLD